jgi:hypothetical protein
MEAVLAALCHLRRSSQILFKVRRALLMMRPSQFPSTTTMTCLAQRRI